MLREVFSFSGCRPSICVRQHESRKGTTISALLLLVATNMLVYVCMSYIYDMLVNAGGT